MEKRKILSGLLKGDLSEYKIREILKELYLRHKMDYLESLSPEDYAVFEIECLQGAAMELHSLRKAAASDPAKRPEMLRYEERLKTNTLDFERVCSLAEQL